LKNSVYIVGDGDPSTPFHYYDCAGFLSQYFKHVPQITSYQHFQFSKEHPNTVFVCEYADKLEASVTIVKDDTMIDGKLLPSILQPFELSAERQL